MPSPVPPPPTESAAARAPPRHDAPVAIAIAAAGAVVLAIFSTGVVALIFLVALVSAVVAIGWSLFASPSRRTVFIAAAGFLGALLGAAAFAYAIFDLNARATPTVYALPTEQEGRQVISPTSVPGVPGMHARVVAKGTGARPKRHWYSRHVAAAPSVQPAALTWLDVEKCDWRVRWRGVESTPDQTCYSSRHDGDLCLADTWLVTGVPADGERFDISYDVNARTRPILERAEIQVAYPFTYGNDVAIGGWISGIGLLVFVGLSLLGGASTLIAYVRARRNRTWYAAGGPIRPAPSAAGPNAQSR